VLRLPPHRTDCGRDAQIRDLQLTFFGIVAPNRSRAAYAPPSHSPIFQPGRIFSPDAMPGTIVILDDKAEMRSSFPVEERFLGRGCQVATATTSKKPTSQLPDRDSFLD